MPDVSRACVVSPDTVRTVRSGVRWASRTRVVRVSRVRCLVAPQLLYVLIVMTDLTSDAVFASAGEIEGQRLAGTGVDDDVARIEQRCHRR